MIPAGITLGISMGDPLGIGPEVVVRALAQVRIRAGLRILIYGQNPVLQLAAEQAGIEPFWMRVAQSAARSTEPLPDGVTVIDFDLPDATRETTPQPTKAGGLVSKALVEEGITDAMRPTGEARHIDALITAPISKESWSMAGYRWPGHTELLASRTHARRHAMAFESPRLRVALATAHLPLMAVRDVLTIGRVFDPIDLGNEHCQRLGIERPRIAVCGLNPHAGERGIFGDEEDRVIRPAIEMARSSGIEAQGPFPGDTIFRQALAGEFDLVVAMYHDQGLIPVKLLAFDRAVNVTLGLPIVRTSPDHGTAFGISGKSRADAGSMRAAIDLAMLLAQSPVRRGHLPR